MNESQLVSVIITTHNRTDLLLRSVESVLAQTYFNIELIVVDDASDTPNIELTRKYSDLNYIYISKEDSRGGNHARNVGIQHSKGTLLAFLDDDDYWLPTKIEKQVELIEKKGCDFVYCGMTLEIIGKDSSVKYQDKPINSRLQGDLSQRILMTVVTTTSNILLRKEVLETVGAFDENLRFWQEYELTIRIAQISHFYYCDEYLTVYRVNPYDAQRLTNKYYEWTQTVKYVWKKHDNLYRKQTLIKRILSRTLFYREAVKRSLSAGLKCKAMYYLVLCSLIYTPYYLYDKIANAQNKKRIYSKK